MVNEIPCCCCIAYPCMYTFVHSMNGGRTAMFVYPNTFCWSNELADVTWVVAQSIDRTWWRKLPAVVA
eukprot:2618752-Karenia_brevis.AAC.1